MPPLDLPNLPSGVDMIVGDRRRPWGYGSQSYIVLIIGGFMGTAFLYYIISVIACQFKSACTRAARAVYNALESALTSIVRSTERCTEAWFQWFTGVVVEVREAGGKEVECGRLTVTAAESASWLEGYSCEVVANSASPAPVAGTRQCTW